MYTRKKNRELSLQKHHFEVLGTEIHILAKFHVSSINICRDKFFDLMTF
jgi:hypothetical protein